MLAYIEEFEAYVAITGFRDVRIRNADAFLRTINRKKPSSVEIQFFDAKFVATWHHLYFAVLNALTVFKNEENISKSLAMEIMLYASAQGQISKATDLIGIKPESSEIASVVVGRQRKDVRSALSMISHQIKAKQDDTVLEMSEEKTKILQKAFGISDLEVRTIMKGSEFDNALVDLVIERMALLITRR